MTVTAQPRRVPYTGNGVTTSFVVTFQFFELDVYLNGVIQEAGTHYTITQTVIGSTGDVVFLTPPANGASIVIVGNTSETQGNDYVEGDSFPAESHERALDRLTMIVQEANGRIENSIRAPLFAAPIGPLDFAGNPNKLIWVGAGGVPSLESVHNTPIGAQLDAAIDEAESARDAAVAAKNGAEAAASTAASEAAEAAAEAAAINFGELVEDLMAEIEGHKDAAEAARDAAQSSQTAAETAETNAETAEAGAEAAQTAAEAARDAAQSAQTAAETAETNAETAETNAEAAQTAAEAARDAAQSAQTAAETAEANAEAAETNAETAETNAEAAQTAAEAARDAAQSAQTAAEAAEANAEAAEAGAAISAAAAAASYDNFDDRWLGNKASDPSLDNDGNALLDGAAYFNTSASPPRLRVYRLSNATWYDGVLLEGTDGDVIGPSSSTDNTLARYDGTSGKLLQGGGPVVNDAGNLGIKGSANAQNTVNITGTIGGSAFSAGVVMAGTIQTDATSRVDVFLSAPSTVAASFTAAEVIGFRAQTATKGAGSTVGNYVAFDAADTSFGNTNNFGFRSGLASGAGKWNVYANGSAPNYFAGPVEVGHVSDTTLSRLGAGRLGVEGNELIHANTNVTGGLTSEVAMPAINYLTGTTYAERWGIPRNDTGVTDRSAALQAAINNSVGELVLPPGAIRLSGSTINLIKRHGLIVRGQGMYYDGSTAEGTRLVIDKSAMNAFSLQSCIGVQFRDMELFGGQMPASGDAFVLTDDGVESFGASVTLFENVRGERLHNFMRLDRANACYLDKIQLRYLYGTHGVKIGGVNRCDILELNRVVCDNPSPANFNYAFKGAWAANTAYVSGDYVTSNGVIYHCVTGGTSHASTAPSGQGTYGNRSVTDGTVTWHAMCSNSLTWLLQDSDAFTVSVDNSRLINGAVGLRMADSLNTGTSFPSWLRLRNVDCDHPFIAGMTCDAGEDVYMSDFWVGSCQSGNAVNLNSSFRGNWRAENSEFCFSAQNGILHNSGPVKIKLTGSQIGHNSISSAGAYHGYAAANGAGRFQIIGNTFDARPTTTSNNQGYGVLVGSGVNDNYHIVNNDGQGNQTALIADTTNNSTRVVSGNFA